MMFIILVPFCFFLLFGPVSSVDSKQVDNSNEHHADYHYNDANFNESNYEASDQHNVWNNNVQEESTVPTQQSAIPAEVTTGNAHSLPTVSVEENVTSKKQPERQVEVIIVEDFPNGQSEDIEVDGSEAGSNIVEGTRDVFQDLQNRTEELRIFIIDRMNPFRKGSNQFVQLTRQAMENVSDYITVNVKPRFDAGREAIASRMNNTVHGAKDIVSRKVRYLVTEGGSIVNRTRKAFEDAQVVVEDNIKPVVNERAKTLAENTRKALRDARQWLFAVAKDASEENSDEFESSGETDFETTTPLSLHIVIPEIEGNNGDRSIPVIEILDLESSDDS